MSLYWVLNVFVICFQIRAWFLFSTSMKFHIYIKKKTKGLEKTPYYSLLFYLDRVQQNIDLITTERYFLKVN